MVNVDRAAPKVTVGKSTRQTQQSTGTGDLDVLPLPSGFPLKGHLMPGFCHTLIGVGPLCDTNCAVTFRRKAVVVRNKKGTAVLTGWCEATGTGLWRIALLSVGSNLPSIPKYDKPTTLAAYSAYDLPIVEALIRYFHTVAGYPVWSSWLKAIGAGNYSSWPGLTLTSTTKYCPSAKATIMRYLVQKRQVVRSTKPKPQPTSSPEDPMTQVRSNGIFF